MCLAQEIRARKLAPRLRQIATEGKVVYHENPTIFRLLRCFVKSFTWFIWLLVYSSHHVKAVPDLRTIWNSLHVVYCLEN